jgi:hypothetical protein
MLVQGMPKITYEPVEEIVVHQILEYDNKTFFEEVMRQNLSQQITVIPTVNWIDGIAFSIWRFTDSDDIVKEALEGKVHYFAVSFTRLPFQTHFSVNMANQDIKVPLRKADNNPNFVSLVGYLKDFKAESKPASQGA